MLAPGSAFGYEGIYASASATPRPIFAEGLRQTARCLRDLSSAGVRAREASARSSGGLTDSHPNASGAPKTQRPTLSGVAEATSDAVARVRARPVSTPMRCLRYSSDAK